MSSKTKIVVLHMKELLYTALFAVLGIALLILLFTLFTPEDTPSENPESTQPSATSESSTEPTASLYIPGLYNTELLLNDQTINVEVIVDGQKITSLQLVDLSETVKTMYPLLQPTFDSLTSQILEKQSLDNVTYNQEHRYTSLVLLEAISKALEKAQP